jgi:hypothetical protein
MKPRVVVPEIPAGLPTVEEEQIAKIVPLMKLSKDAKEAAKLLTAAQVRFLVDFYYQIQEHRKAAANQLQSLETRGEPSIVFNHFAHLLMTTERQAGTLLDIYSGAQRLGQWARDVDGIGPIIAAGLLAHVDLQKSTTAGKLWRFAGLDPTNTWYGREKSEALLKTLAIPAHPATEDLLRVAEASHRSLERITILATDAETGEVSRKELVNGLAKRPWNAALKVLCWKIGKSFVYVSGKPTAFYGHMYAARKAQEESKNEAGDFAAQAKQILAERTIRNADHKKCYEAGKLPPGHIQTRAERYAVKMFLSHYLEVGRRLAGLPVVAPFVIEHMGHSTKIEPPNLPPELR